MGILANDLTQRPELIVVGLVAGLGAAWLLWRADDEAVSSVIVDTPVIGDVVRLIDEAVGAVRNPAIQSMAPSWALIQTIKRLEGGPLLERRNLGDGGYTIGFGRFERDPAMLPERITAQQAEAMLLEDIEARGARWVRAYVTVALDQQQFDALTSMAYNLSPQSFRTIAAAVNRGDSPDAAALRYVLPGTRFERGLRNRRGAELAIYHQGVYA